MTQGIALDASVAMTWCFADEHSHYAYSVLDSMSNVPAQVPAIWPTEVANCLLVGERRGRLTTAEIARFLTLVDALPIHIDPQTAERALSATISLAREYELSAYDAAYLELASRQGLALATLDKKLKKAAISAGVSVFESS